MNEPEFCPATVAARAEDVQRFRDMPGGTNAVASLLVCELTTGHQGAHVYGIQEELSDQKDEEGDPLTVYWWAMWGADHPSPYSVASVDACPNTYPSGGSEDSFCCLPLDHTGPHSGGRSGV